MRLVLGSIRRLTLRRTLLALLTLGLVSAFAGPAMAQAPTKQPNILVIWGDDIG